MVKRHRPQKGEPKLAAYVKLSLILLSMVGVVFILAELVNRGSLVIKW